MPVRNENRGENRQRLLEIMEVMRRHEIVKGITPEKLCAIIEGLAPRLSSSGRFSPCGQISCPPPIATR